MNFEKKYIYVPVFGDERYKKGMVGCYYGGRYATAEREGGGVTGTGVICGYTNVWCRLKNNKYVAPKK